MCARAPWVWPEAVVPLQGHPKKKVKEWVMPAWKE